MKRSLTQSPEAWTCGRNTTPAFEQNALNMTFRAGAFLAAAGFATTSANAESCDHSQTPGGSCLRSWKGMRNQGKLKMFRLEG